MTLSNAERQKLHRERQKENSGRVKALEARVAELEAELAAIRQENKPYVFSMTAEQQAQEHVDAAHRGLDAALLGQKTFAVFLFDVLKERVWERSRALNMGMLPPVPFADMVRDSYPRGLGTDIATIRRQIALCPGEAMREAVATIFEAVVSEHGGEAAIMAPRTKL